MTKTESAEEFLSRLQEKAATFEKLISTAGGDWIVKGFIDIFKNVYCGKENRSTAWPRAY